MSGIVLIGLLMVVGLFSLFAIIFSDPSPTGSLSLITWILLFLLLVDIGIVIIGKQATLLLFYTVLAVLAVPVIFAVFSISDSVLKKWHPKDTSGPALGVDGEASVIKSSASEQKKIGGLDEEKCNYEAQRIKKRLAKLDRVICIRKTQLANPRFLCNATTATVTKAKLKLSQAIAKRDAIIRES